MRRLRENKAITLMALVITIIVLVILAGIAISQLTKNGLIENSKIAKEEYANAQAKEDVALKQYENAINDGTVGGTRDDNYAKLEKQIQDLQEEVNALRESQTSGNFVVFDKDNVVKEKTTCTAGTEYTYTATQNCAISYGYYFRLSDGGSGKCEVDGITIAPMYCSASSNSQYFNNRGIVYIKTGQVFKMKSVQYGGEYTVYGLK